MKLYIDDREAFFDTEFDANMTFKFLDTYNPSAVKTPYSTTISLPDCKANAEIFSSFKLKYSFDLFSDDGRIIEKGYCILDNVKTEGVTKTYNITLYGGLGDFFYNLKGDEDSPKTLADLYWGDITGLSRDVENSSSLVTWNPDYVVNTWTYPEGFRDTFRAVPCIYDDKKMDKTKTIIPADSAPEIFPSESYAYVSTEDLTKGFLITAEENDCYGKQDFRVDFMPLGIKYKSIIETCCKPYNNGGYSVELDPSFFNASNPYWTDMFLLKSLPTQDYDYSTNTGSFENFTCSLITVGQSTTLIPNGMSDVWTSTDSGSIQLQEGVKVIENRVYYNLQPFIEVSSSQVPDILDDPHSTYVTCTDSLQINLNITNVDSGETRLLAGVSYNPDTKWNILSGEGLFVPDLYIVSPFKGMATLPENWTNVKFSLKASGPSSGFTIHYNDRYLWTDHWKTKVVDGAFKVPSKSTYFSTDLKTKYDDYQSEGVEWPVFLPDSYLKVESLLSGDVNPYEELEFSKKDLLGKTKSPFEYLIWYTKMFNLRFYLEPGTKKVSILQADNFVNQLEPLNIQDKVCYDREYTKSRKIIDEGYLKFNLTPNKNETVTSYEETSGKELLDSTFRIPGAESKNEKEYLTTSLKVGSKSRITGNLSRRHENGSNFYGFNQNSPLTISYIKDGQVATEEISLNYQSGFQKYDFLKLQDKVDDTVVMFTGLKDTPFDSPATISTTSLDMVKYAGKPCYIGGLRNGSQNTGGTLLGARYIYTYKIPSYGLVSSNYDYGLSYSNVDYQSLIVTGNIYDKYIKDFVEKIYTDPVVVECYVRLDSPELRRLYWFDNTYWILTEISGYNYRDEPVKCKFIRYITKNA